MDIYNTKQVLYISYYFMYKAQILVGMGHAGPVGSVSTSQLQGLGFDSSYCE